MTCPDGTDLDPHNPHKPVQPSQAVIPDGEQQNRAEPAPTAAQLVAETTQALPHSLIARTLEGFPEKPVRISELLETDAGHALAKHIKKPVLKDGPCSKCGGQRDRGPDKPYCRKCHNAYQKQWQADQRKLLRRIRASGLNLAD